MFTHFFTGPHKELDFLRKSRLSLDKIKVRERRLFL